MKLGRAEISNFIHKLMAGNMFPIRVGNCLHARVQPIVLNDPCSVIASQGAWGKVKQGRTSFLHCELCNTLFAHTLLLPKKRRNEWNRISRIKLSHGRQLSCCFADYIFWSGSTAPAPSACQWKLQSWIISEKHASKVFQRNPETSLEIQSWMYCGNVEKQSPGSFNVCRGNTRSCNFNNFRWVIGFQDRVDVQRDAGALLSVFSASIVSGIQTSH